MTRQLGGSGWAAGLLRCWPAGRLGGSTAGRWRFSRPSSAALDRVSEVLARSRSAFSDQFSGLPYSCENLRGQIGEPASLRTAQEGLGTTQESLGALEETPGKPRLPRKAQKQPRRALRQPRRAPGQPRKAQRQLRRPRGQSSRPGNCPGEPTDSPGEPRDYLGEEQEQPRRVPGHRALSSIGFQKS